METPRDYWRFDQGLTTKSVAFILFGGDKYSENYVGHLKNVKLYYDSNLSPPQIRCHIDEHCTEC